MSRWTKIVALAGIWWLAVAGTPAVPPRLELPDVTSFELSEPGTVGTRPSGSRLSVPARRVISRPIPDLWELWLLDGERPEDLTVHYEMIDGTGRRGHLSHSGNPGERIQVRLRPLPPRAVREEDGATFVEGGVLLDLSLGGARRSGTYQGSLTVTIHRL